MLKSEILWDPIRLTRCLVGLASFIFPVHFLIETTRIIQNIEMQQQIFFLNKPLKDDYHFMQPWAQTKHAGMVEELR